MTDPQFYRAPVTDLPLFAPPPAPVTTPAPKDVRGMVRNPDRETSVAAAENVATSREAMKAVVLEAFKTHGEMTDGELELLPEFNGKAINSVRKRRTDLLQDGSLEWTGEKRAHPDRPKSLMMVWRVRRTS
jgi:hypothetical protein